MKADYRELGRMEDHIVRTAVYRLIAPREAAVLGERDWLPGPRLVNPEVRARTARNAMDLVARLLTGFACEARGSGWSWGEQVDAASGCAAVTARAGGGVLAGAEYAVGGFSRGGAGSVSRTPVRWR